MITLTETILSKIYPYARTADISNFLDPLNKVTLEFQINLSQLRLAAFLAEIGVESGQLRNTQENLNYSAQTLQRVWPIMFPPGTAEAYAHNPEKIANRAYANRMGNGEEESGDGWKYRGRGLIQITGKYMYSQLETYFNDPNLLELPDGATWVSGWFWNKHQLNTLADEARFDQISRVINGGDNGKVAREQLYNTTLRVLVGI